MKLDALRQTIHVVVGWVALNAVVCIKQSGADLKFSSIAGQI